MRFAKSSSWWCAPVAVGIGALAIFALDNAHAACAGCSTAAGTTATCQIEGGGSVSVNCSGQICPAETTCSRCNVYNSQGHVVGCECQCVPCVDCLGA